MRRDGNLEMLDAVVLHKIDVLGRILLSNQGAISHQLGGLFLRRGMSSHRIVFKPREYKCSKLPPLGKLLRYKPGTTSAKLTIGPLLGEGGPLFSTLGVPGLLT